MDPPNPPEQSPQLATVTVDARGLRCPLPVIRLAKAAQTLAPGTVVVVLSTDPAAVHDVPAWARMRGHTWLGPQTAPDDEEAGAEEAGAEEAGAQEWPRVWRLAIRLTD